MIINVIGAKADIDAVIARFPSCQLSKGAGESWEITVPDERDGLSQDASDELMDDVIDMLDFFGSDWFLP
jgi:hypothetical protein